MRKFMLATVLCFASSTVFAAPSAFQARLGAWKVVACTATGSVDVCHLTDVTIGNRDLADGGSATVVEGTLSDTTGNYAFRQILTAQGMPNVACTESPDTAVCNFQGNAQTVTARDVSGGAWTLNIVSTAGGKPLQVHLTLR